MAIINTTDSSFEKDVLKAKKLVILDFWAEWCGPCIQIGSVLKDISNEKSEILDVVKINIDENQETPRKYGVRGIPTLMIFRDGELIDTKVGSLPKTTMIEWIDSLIS